MVRRAARRICLVYCVVVFRGPPSLYYWFCTFPWPCSLALWYMLFVFLGRSVGSTCSTKAESEQVHGNMQHKQRTQTDTPNMSSKLNIYQTNSCCSPCQDGWPTGHNVSSLSAVLEMQSIILLIFRQSEHVMVLHTSALPCQGVPAGQAGLMCPAH